MLASYMTGALEQSCEMCDVPACFNSAMSTVVVLFSCWQHIALSHQFIRYTWPNLIQRFCNKSSLQECYNVFLFVCYNVFREVLMRLCGKFWRMCFVVLLLLYYASWKQVFLLFCPPKDGLPTGQSRPLPRSPRPPGA